MAANALKTFELENNIRETDAIYKYDNATNQKNLSGKGWTKDPRWFKHVRISALALVKITMHARSGSNNEVMGLMLGKIDPDDPRGPTMVVLDAFALPVEGTETRVNAQADAYEYMVEFLSQAKESGRLGPQGAPLRLHKAPSPRLSQPRRGGTAVPAAPDAQLQAELEKARQRQVQAILRD